MTNEIFEKKNRKKRTKTGKKRREVEYEDDYEEGGLDEQGESERMDSGNGDSR